jgi:surface antigen
MRQARIPAIALIPILLTACGPEGPSKADTGLIVGGVAGGIIGSEIGRSMDEQDRRLAQQAEYDALEEGESDRPRRWKNAENGRYGDVVPGRPYKRGSVDCRDYTHTVYIDGRPKTMRGTACRNPDGTWRNVA